MRINNPSIDELQTLVSSIPDRAFTIQFDNDSAYGVVHLRLVNEICTIAGPQASIRFYGHYWSTIDCAIVSQITACRSLELDCHKPLANIGAIAMMPALETFRINVFEANYDEVLTFSNVRSVSRLFIGTNRKTDWDLLPLRDFSSLRELGIAGQNKNIGRLRDMASIQSLSLFSIPRKVSLAFVSDMAGLKRLKIMLGGRDTMDEVAHSGVTDLDVIWVKGLTHLDCTLFPAIETFKIEDQAQITVLDLSRNPELRSIHIHNCKSLVRLTLREIGNLRSLFIGRTAIDPELFLAGSLPTGLAALDLYGYGSKRDATIEALLRSRGYRSVYRDKVH